METDIRDIAKPTIERSLQENWNCLRRDRFSQRGFEIGCIINIPPAKIQRQKIINLLSDLMIFFEKRMIIPKTKTNM